MKAPRLPGFFLLVVLLLGSCTLAEPDFPLTVYVNIFFNSIAKVDGVEQSFAADFYMTIYWVDNSYNDTEPWNPNVEFQNSQGDVTAQFPDPPFVAEDPPARLAKLLGLPESEIVGNTWVKYDQRYVGSFNSRLQLNDFPFDQQDVLLAVESALFNEEAVTFKPVKDLADAMLPEGMQVIEWTVVGTSTEVRSNYYRNFDETYSRLEIRVTLDRQSDYYVWKIFLGSILLVIMAIAIFALKIDEADRMMGTITIFLALVSFLFVAGSSIPKVAYQTRLDNFMNFSFFMVFFILLAHGAIYSLRLALPQRIQKPYKVAQGQGEKSTEQMVTEDGPSLDGFQGFDKVTLVRKLDLFCIVLFSIIYVIGVPLILYGPTTAQP